MNIQMQAKRLAITKHFIIIAGLTVSLGLAQPSSTSLEGLGLATPESVLYDQANDVYLISNINGSPFEEDNNGFISKLSPDGKMQTLKWLEGGRDGVTLHAPKGSVIVGENFYVADLTVIKVFNLGSGDFVRDIPVPGSSFLNDMTAAPNSDLYVTDTGLKATATGFEPNGTDAVYRITPNDEVQVVARGLELGNPNGITVLQDGTVFVNASSGEMYKLQEGQKIDATTLPGNNLDGVLELSDGSIINSSWETSSLYKTVDGQTTVLATDLPTPADFGLDSKRTRLLVPIFSENRIVMIDLLN